MADTQVADATQAVRKNIVICADGTGNTAVKGRGTNVFKLYEAIDQAGHRFNGNLIPQIALYDDGVGTETVRWLALITGAFGWGLSRNVKQLYAELARVYTPGDKIYLFGFSRGAFTVRTLAGLVHTCGVLDVAGYDSNAALEGAVRDAYKEYRQHYNSWLTRLFVKTKTLDNERIVDLRKRFSVAVPEFAADQGPGRLIEFIGVWDTVDAVGLPVAAAEFVNTWIYNFKFPDRILNSSVAHACHALALDEEREAFQPVLWNQSKTPDPERIEQVWFAGVHSNVGGGYPRQGMSLSALDWMMHRAEQHGLRFVPADRLSYRYHGDVDDKMYDSRAGVGVFYRWKPRDVEALCQANGITPKLHRSVFERIARNTDGYAPGSVPPCLTVVSKSAPVAVTDEIKRLVEAQHAGGQSLVRQEGAAQVIGRTSYRLFVYSVVVTALLTVAAFYRDATAGTVAWTDVARNLAGDLVSSKWLAMLLQTLWRYPWLGILLVVSFLMALYVDNRLDRVYSEFWHRNDLRGRLRDLMY